MAEAPGPYFRAPGGSFFLLFFPRGPRLGLGVEANRRWQKEEGRERTTNQEQGLVAEGEDANLDIGKELLGNGRCFSGRALLNEAL